MNKLDIQYLDLIKHILNNGTVSDDRTGTGTLKTFVNVIRHDMRDGFPLLTVKNVYFKGVICELLWFLQGGKNIKYMVDNNVNIWVGDAYKKYKDTVKEPLSEEEFIYNIKNSDEFSSLYGDLGPVYGSQWRNWNNEGIDQLKEVINSLKTNPSSRRHIVTAWNPSKLNDMTLPPCHNMFQFYTEKIKTEDRLNLLSNKIENIDLYNLKDQSILNRLFTQNDIPEYYLSLNFNMRSVDVGLGLPFDIASYGTLLLMVAKETKYMAKELICTLNDTHIYLNHVDDIKLLLDRTIYPLPEIELNSLKNIDTYTLNDIKLINYKHSGKLNLKLSN